jgi:NAD(P)-dependent dehydrogenase (short-subunit alcohol dehydrogenase family)
MQAGIRHMLARKEAGDPGGSLLACGSLLTRFGVARAAHYAAAKGALASVVQCIAAEYGGDGIRANIVLPGFIQSNSFSDDRFTKMLEERTPIPRWGRPADLRGIAAYLMSDAASFHTGDLITIDGGWSSGVF